MPEFLELRVSVEVYGLDAIFQAAYKFTDRAYLFLRLDDADHVIVEFRTRAARSVGSDLVGLFANELIDQRLRGAIAAETKLIRDRIYAQAFQATDLNASA
jgi:His-Xaa-Ser system protein HxsD